MIDINVTIDGIVLFCDESVVGIHLGNGYVFGKKAFEDLSFKNKIIDGVGNISINYLGSRIFDENDKVFFICLHKNDVYQAELPEVKNGETMVMTDSDLMCDNQVQLYKDREVGYLYKMFSLLRLFKQGNIGYKELFLTHTFRVVGFMDNTQKQTNIDLDQNIVDTTIYSLTDDEIVRCNQFLQDYSGREYDLLKNSIDEFVWGLDQTDEPTGFEQYTTALEMTLLDVDQQGKKQVLSKRVAVLLGTTPTEVANIYNKMTRFYRYRSESLHEGDGSNITGLELKDLEEIVRNVLVKYLAYCKVQVSNNPTITWEEIKNAKMTELKNQVLLEIGAGVLPA